MYSRQHEQLGVELKDDELEALRPTPAAAHTQDAYHEARQTNTWTKLDKPNELAQEVAAASAMDRAFKLCRNAVRTDDIQLCNEQKIKT
eukprot:3029851-Pleurochrysis_carterae.AAC.2